MVISTHWSQCIAIKLSDAMEFDVVSTKWMINVPPDG